MCTTRKKPQGRLFTRKSTGSSRSCGASARVMAYSVDGAVRDRAHRGGEEARHDDEHPGEGEQVAGELGPGTAGAEAVVDEVDGQAEGDDREPRAKQVGHARSLLKTTSVY